MGLEDRLVDVWGSPPFCPPGHPHPDPLPPSGRGDSYRTNNVWLDGSGLASLKAEEKT